ncbi:MAG: methyltransferase domain-containing protein [SAR324 cluster bacterium]|nr:methyltransferase domain-containing protein [SAR324 cluster bacterium]
MTDFYTEALKYFESVQPSPPVWLGQIKREGLAEKVPIIRDDMGVFIRMICALVRPAFILEIGCGISYATHWMLLGSPQSRIVAIDSNHLRLARCRTYLEKSGFMDQVDLNNCWAEDFFNENHQQFDLIFQDSTKKGYAGMIDQCYQCLKPGGILIVDNIFFNGKVLGLTPGQEKKYGKGVAALKTFNKIIAQHPGFDCSFLPLSDGVLLAQRIR